MSDYLFPGEGPQEALLSLQELLDLEVQENNVQKDIELEAGKYYTFIKKKLHKIFAYMCIIINFFKTDPSEFYSQNKINVKTTDLNIDSSGNRQTKIYIASFSIAILIVILAIIIQKLY